MAVTRGYRGPVKPGNSEALPPPPPPHSRNRWFRRALLSLTSLVLVLICVWIFWPRQPDVRGFDPDAAAGLEARMWRHYYERKHQALVLDLYRLARCQYGFSPSDSIRIAWHAGMAAAAFQPTRSRQEAQAALPELERYFRVIVDGAADLEFDPAKAAREELEWWQQRREKKTWPDYAVTAAQALATVYGISMDRALEPARLRCEMMHECDSRRRTGITEADWARIEQGLKRSWAALKQAIDET